MKLTIEKRHLDAARAVKWSTETCVLQQALKENGFNLYNEKGACAWYPDDKGREIIRFFDDDLIKNIIPLLPAEVEFTEVKQYK